MITGGFSNVRGLKERIKTGIQSVAPYESTINIKYSSNNSMNHAWMGAKKWVDNIGINELNKYAITKQEFMEEGAHRTGFLKKTNPFSNIY